MVKYSRTKPNTRHPHLNIVTCEQAKKGMVAWRIEEDKDPVECIFIDRDFIPVTEHRERVAAKKAENSRRFQKGSVGWFSHVLPKILGVRFLRKCSAHISPGSPTVPGLSGGWEMV